MGQNRGRSKGRVKREIERRVVREERGKLNRKIEII